MLRRFLAPLLTDRFLQLLLVLGIALAVLTPFNVQLWLRAIDWQTIVTLTGLMILTKGVELSGYFDLLARRVVVNCRSERQLAMLMVTAAAVLATFLTNDVALFILVPLTLALNKFCAFPVSKLIIFEALAVNIGSLLTPIGNPQNILLWGHSGVTFSGFIVQMAPLAIALLASLLFLSFCCFSRQALHYQAEDRPARWQPKLVYSCLVLYVIFILSLEWQLILWGVAIVALSFAIMARRVLAEVDWSLLLVFILMFIDVDMLTRLPLLHDTLHQIQGLTPNGLYGWAVVLSQIISNVPATILLLNYVPATPMLAFAVNIGGLGLAMGSMANIIALRMAKDRKIWLHFHFYSIPLLFWSLFLGGLILGLIE